MIVASKKVSDYVIGLYKKQIELDEDYGDVSFHALMSDVVLACDHRDAAIFNLGIEEEKDSYFEFLDEEDRNRLIELTKGTEKNYYEIIVPTDDDISIYYFLGGSEDEMVETLKRRVEELIRASAFE